MILLSYPISEDMPMYGGGPGPHLHPDKRLHAGDSCNTLNIAMSNHTGTHIDLPAHFFENGATLSDYRPEFWATRKVYCAFYEQRPAPGTLIGANDLAALPALDRAPADCEALILKTGYCDVRGDALYYENSPGIHSDAADYLRRRFPALRFLGFDLISVTSRAHREMGRAAHRALLQPDHAILPIEDMDLRRLPAHGLRNLLVSPLQLAGADGAPCTIWGDLFSE